MLMEKITIFLSTRPRFKALIKNFPELTSEKKLVHKGIEILKRYTPDILNYLSKQRVLAHLPTYLIEIHDAGGMPESEVRSRLENWMRRKRNRRLAYVILELLLMPFTAFVAILPGPNIVFYALFVLFYFHMKAFISLSKVKVEELNISINRDA
jgi:hypothetical protein